MAVANLKSLCNTHLPDSHEIEIVDVFPEPLLALAGRILITPALVKLSPPPVRSIVGTLADTDAVLRTSAMAPVV